MDNAPKAIDCAVVDNAWFNNFTEKSEATYDISTYTSLFNIKLDQFISWKNAIMAITDEKDKVVAINLAGAEFM